MKDRTNQNTALAIILSLSTLFCVGLCFVAPHLLLFFTVVPFFCLQLLLLRLTKRIVLRLVPVYPIVLLLLAAGYYGLFGKGWDTLAALIFALLAIAPAIGCLLAFGAFRLSGIVLTRKWAVTVLTLLGWALAWTGQEISLGYWDRSLIKLLGFGGCIGLYRLICRDPDVLSIFRMPDRRSLKTAATLCVGVFLFLTVGYMVLSPWLDLSAIPEQLRLHDITADNFPLVAGYITFINSLLEEVFFRGFAFLTLRRYATIRFAYLFSGIAFALYHVSIMANWFHPIWFVVFIAGLAVAGMLFDWLDRRGSIWCGYLVHAGANLAINLIGMRMFGIL